MPYKEAFPPLSLSEDKCLDPGIVDAVNILRANGIETFESCQGGIGHPFPEPTIRFHGDEQEGYCAALIARKNGFNVACIRKVYDLIEDTGEFDRPVWEIVFFSDVSKNIALDRSKGVFVGLTT